MELELVMYVLYHKFKEQFSLCMQVEQTVSDIARQKGKMTAGEAAVQHLAAQVTVCMYLYVCIYNVEYTCIHERRCML